MPGFLSPRACSNSYPLSQWCHPTISSSVNLFPFYLQSFPASGSFPMSQFFASGGQSIGASTSASVLPVNVQGWFPLGLTSVISFLSNIFGWILFFLWEYLNQCWNWVQRRVPSLITSWVSLCSLLNWATETSSFPILNQRRMTQMWREIIKLFLENEQPWAHLKSTVNNMKFEVNIIVSLKWVCTKLNSVFYPMAFLYILVIIRTSQIILSKVEI